MHQVGTSTETLQMIVSHQKKACEKLKHHLDNTVSRTVQKTLNGLLLNLVEEHGSKNSQLNSVLIWIKGQNMSARDMRSVYTSLHPYGLSYTAVLIGVFWHYLLLYSSQGKCKKPCPSWKNKQTTKHLILLSQDQCIIKRIPAYQLHTWLLRTLGQNHSLLNIP